MRRQDFYGPNMNREMQRLVAEDSPARVNPATDDSLERTKKLGDALGRAFAFEDLSAEPQFWTVEWMLDPTEEDSVEIDPRTREALIEAVFNGFMYGAGLWEEGISNE